MWRTGGAEKAFFLKDLIERFGLLGSSSRVLAFDRACRGLDMCPEVYFPEIDIEVSAFWQLCVAELGIEDESGSLIGLVQIVMNWSPDEVASTIAAG